MAVASPSSYRIELVSKSAVMLLMKEECASSEVPWQRNDFEFNS